MPRYIDADELIKKIFPIGLVDDGKYTINAKAVKYAIDSAPTADVVEVVRCKDCIHSNDAGCAEGLTWCDNMDRGVTDEHFCSYGERKEKMLVKVCKKCKHYEKVLRKQHPNYPYAWCKLFKKRCGNVRACAIRDKLRWEKTSDDNS